MHGVAALLAAAALAHLVARAFHAPVIPLLLLSGLGLSLVDPVPSTLLQDALVLGVSFLLFVSGMELAPRKVRAQRRAAVQIGLVQFVVLGVMGFLVALTLGYTPLEGVYIGLALTASSTLVGVRLLQRRRQMFEPFGRVVLGVLLLQDLLVLLAIPLAIELAVGWQAALAAFGAVALLGGAALVVRRWVAPVLVRFDGEPEVVLLGALSVLFLFLGVSSFLEVPLVLGAFLAGITLSRFPVDGVVRSKLAPIGDFFAAIFFVALGALVTLPSPAQVGHALLFIFVVMGTTLPLVSLLASRAGLSTRSAVEAALLLSQTSEISLVLGLSGLLLGHIGVELFTVIALVTLVTMLLTPFVATDQVAWRITHLLPAPGVHEGPVPSGHVLVVGAGSTGGPLVEDLIVSGCSVAVVDDDPKLGASLEEAGVLVVRGDVTDARALERAGASRARVVVSAIRRPRDNETLLEMAAGVPVLVRVFDAPDADWIRARGGTPILFSQATARGLLEWMEEEREDLEDGLQRRLADAAPEPARG